MFLTYKITEIAKIRQRAVYVMFDTLFTTSLGNWFMLCFFVTIVTVTMTIGKSDIAFGVKSRRYSIPDAT